MNYNQIFINKCSLLLDSRKTSTPTSVFEYYKNINLYQKRNIKTLKEMTNEIKCLFNAIDNLIKTNDWDVISLKIKEEAM